MRSSIRPRNLWVFTNSICSLSRIKGIWGILLFVEEIDLDGEKLVPICLTNFECGLESFWLSEYRDLDQSQYCHRHSSFTYSQTLIDICFLCLQTPLQRLWQSFLSFLEIFLGFFSFGNSFSHP